MTKPTISIYREQKPAHYVGADCNITLTHKSNIEQWQIDEIENVIIANLRDVLDYTFLPV